MPKMFCNLNNKHLKKNINFLLQSCKQVVITLVAQSTPNECINNFTFLINHLSFL